MNILPDLFLSFAKVGLFTFGGGYAMIGILGSLVATIAVVLPSFIIILLVTALLKTVLKDK